MRIQPIVEGFGEVAALPVLLRRLQVESGAFELVFHRPIRQDRSKLTQESALRRAVKLALLNSCQGILIVLDGDGDCPKELALTIHAWAKQEAPHVVCEVVIAYREYEAWFLAALESLRGSRGVHLSASYLHPPESIRGAKEALRIAMPGYSPRVDQAALTESV